MPLSAPYSMTNTMTSESITDRRPATGSGAFARDAEHADGTVVGDQSSVTVLSPDPTNSESPAQTSDALARLETMLRSVRPAAVAVSGGVDSLTLAAVAARVLGTAVTMYHAVSPAVPPAATARVARHAALAGWQLVCVDAGEFSDRRYVENPAERCFFCKQNLYGTVSAAAGVQVLSGTNLDDLDDWRPGLTAAKAAGVRHPFVEAGIAKAGVRAIARHLGLDDVAELPAAPCLSSRVETGIPIAATDLRFIDAAETFLRGALAAATVRCRLRRAGIVIELDDETHDTIDDTEKSRLCATLQALARDHGVVGTVTLAPYRRGSAFVRATR